MLSSVGKSVCVRSRKETWFLHGSWETESAPQSHFPGQYWTVYCYWRVFSFRDCNLELVMLLIFLSLSIPKRGLWSMTTMSSLHPKTNICVLLRLQVTARHSPSVSAYQLSGSVINLHPSSIARCHPYWYYYRGISLWTWTMLLREISDSFLTPISLKASMLVDIKCFDSFFHYAYKYGFWFCKQLVKGIIPAEFTFGFNLVLWEVTW